MTAFKRRIFDYQDCPAVGWGFAPRTKYINGVYPCTEGETFAHDAVEHIDGFARIGTVTDELAAIGAILYGRGQGIDLGLTNDLSGLAVFSPNNLPAPRNVRGCLGTGFQWELEDVLSEARKHVLQELLLCRDDEDETLEDSTDDFLTSAKLWMEYGAKRAEKEYGSPTNIRGCYSAVRDLINRLPHWLTNGGEYHRIIIDLKPKDCDVRVIVSNGIECETFGWDG